MVLTKTARKRHVLIAWELGGGLGHITRVTAIAKGFLEAGCRVSLCLQDLSKAYKFVAHLPVQTFQTPLWQTRWQTGREPVCFSDILMHRGYGSPNDLHGLVRAWRTLVETLQPDLLVLDYAPTALLAMRDKALPQVLLGSGFAEIPPGQPDRCLRPWLSQADEQTLNSERRVVQVVNRVVAELGIAPIQRVSDIYQGESRHLFNLIVPEVDLWKGRRDVTYLPPIVEPGSMEPAVWPEGQAAKVFAYLKPSSKHCVPVLESMAQTPCVGLAVCPGLAKETSQRFRRPGLHIHPNACDLTHVVREADVVVCHAGKNTVSEAALAGKPVLLIPEQLEQFHGALLMEKAGGGILVHHKCTPEQTHRALQRLLSDKGIQQASRTIAANNAALAQVEPVAALLNYCERLLADHVEV